MAIFQGLLIIVFGIGLVGIAIQSLSTGWLPCGPNGLKGRLEFRRERQPLGYWTMFVVYGGGGLWLGIFGLRLLLGSAEPLPL